MAITKGLLKNNTYQDGIYPKTGIDCVFDEDGNSLEVTLSLQLSPVWSGINLISPSKVYKVLNIVMLNVRFNLTTTFGSNEYTRVVQLPEGFRPTERVWIGWTKTNTSGQSGYIEPDGTVYAYVMSSDTTNINWYVNCSFAIR